MQTAKEGVGLSRQMHKWHSQAFTPLTGCQPFPNTVGTAPGMEDWQLQNLFGSWTAASHRHPVAAGLFHSLPGRRRNCACDGFFYINTVLVCCSRYRSSRLRWEQSRRKRTSEAGVDRDGNSPAAFPMILLRFPFIFVISHPIYGNDGNIITELSVAVKARSTGCLFGMPIALFEYSVSCGNGAHRPNMDRRQERENRRFS